MIDKDEDNWTVEKLLDTKRKFIDDVVRRISNTEPPESKFNC